MGTRARRFFARFNRLELSAPLVQASSGHPELLGQLIDAFTALHPLYGHALKLPGISLSSLHECFLSRRVCPSRVCQFKGSFHFSRLPFLPARQWRNGLPPLPFLSNELSDGVSLSSPNGWSVGPKQEASVETARASSRP